MSDASTPPRPCDCLDRCGDDPRLGQFGVAPCEAAQDRRLAYLEATVREVKVKRRLAELGFGTNGLLEALDELKSLREREPRWATTGCSPATPGGTAALTIGF